jgi:Acyl-coenzyme A:6-aminopenicillanic acid acyl-transferase
LRLRLATLWIVWILLLAGCQPAPGQPGPAATAPAAAPFASPTPRPDGLTPEEAATLASLTKVDAYPLYSMTYQSSYRPAATQWPGAAVPAMKEGVRSPAWACSLFAALGDAKNRLYGRNFDWRFSPALLLYLDPPDGYASVSLVDMEYFGFGDGSQDLTTLPLARRRALLGAPSMPFDGMNEAGLAVGMAAVPEADERHDPDKPSIGSLAVIREILDHAGRMDDAVAILSRYNIDWEGGPPLHYLVADRFGGAALVEYNGGRMEIIANHGPWNAATNFTVSDHREDPAGQCERYDALVERLVRDAGTLTPADAMNLLSAVSQPETQWSAVYNLSVGHVNIVMGRQYRRVHGFSLFGLGEQDE